MSFWSTDDVDRSSYRYTWALVSHVLTLGPMYFTWPAQADYESSSFHTMGPSKALLKALLMFHLCGGHSEPYQAHDYTLGPNEEYIQAP